MVFQQYLCNSKKMCENFSGLSSHKFLLCEYLKNSFQYTLQIVFYLKVIIDSRRKLFMTSPIAKAATPFLQTTKYTRKVCVFGLDVRAAF